MPAESGAAGTIVGQRHGPPRERDPRGSPMPTTTQRATLARIDGVLLASVALDRCFASLDPPDDVYLFRAGPQWTVLMVRRTEDDGSRSATVSIEHATSTEDLADLICSTYG